MNTNNGSMYVNVNNFYLSESRKISRKGYWTCKIKAILYNRESYR